MYKLTFFVHTAGWSTGGYENAHYFETEEAAMKWAEGYRYVEVLKCEKVSGKEFAADYIGELY